MKTCIKCGSHAFNLYAEEIDQGGFCDVHYWQGRAHRAEAQPEQEPVAKVEPCAVCGEGNARLLVLRSCDTCHSEYAGQAEMKVALGKPEQEPVAFSCLRCVTPKKCAVHGCSPNTWPSEYSPKRPWVGLTTEEIALIDWESLATKKDCVQAIEAKLKEKNT